MAKYYDKIHKNSSTPNYNKQASAEKKIGNKYYMYNHLIGFNDQFYDITVYSVVPPHNTLKSTNLKHVLILRKKKLWKKDTDKQYMH